MKRIALFLVATAVAGCVAVTPTKIPTRPTSLDVYNPSTYRATNSLADRIAAHRAEVRTPPPMPVAVVSSMAAPTASAVSARSTAAPAVDTNGIVIMRWQKTGQLTSVWRGSSLVLATTNDNCTIRGLTVGSNVTFTVVPEKDVWLNAPVPSSVTLAWDASPDASVAGYRVYYGVATGDYTNSAAVGNVSNAVFTNLGVSRYYFAATAYDSYGVESPFSNEASYRPPLTAVVLSSTNWPTPQPTVVARSFSWKCAPGVTNILQASANLTAWSNAAKFRGTNGTATVTITNALAFHRVLIQNATNVPPMTLTQGIAYVGLTWTGNGTPKLLEREIDSKTGSYAPVLTNSASGAVSVVVPFTGSRYRVSTP